MNAPDRDLHDAADGELRAAAVENITHRIISGQSRITIRDLIDIELSSDRYMPLIAEFEALVTAESGERAALADKAVKGLMDRYIAAHDDLVEEEAETIEHYEQEGA